MKETRNVIIGIMAVILGLIVLVFPLVSVVSLSKIAGIGIIFLGIWLLAQSLKSGSFAAGIIGLFLAIIAIMFGIVFIANIKMFEFLTFMSTFIAGFFIAIAGLSSLISGEGLKTKVIGALGVVIGVLFIIISSYLDNSLVAAAVIGAFLIIAGIMEIFDMFGEIGSGANQDGD